MVVAVGVVGEDAVEPLAQHLQQRVRRLASPLVQARRQPLRITPALIELTNRQQPGIGADPPAMGLDNHGRMWEKIEGQLTDSLLRHQTASVRIKLWRGNRVRTHEGRFFNGSCIIRVRGQSGTPTMS